VRRGGRGRGSLASGSRFQHEGQERLFGGKEVREGEGVRPGFAKEHESKTVTGPESGGRR